MLNSKRKKVVDVNSSMLYLNPESEVLSLPSKEFTFDCFTIVKRKDLPSIKEILKTIRSKEKGLNISEVYEESMVFELGEVERNSKNKIILRIRFSPVLPPSNVGALFCYLMESNNVIKEIFRYFSKSFGVITTLNTYFKVNEENDIREKIKEFAKNNEYVRTIGFSDIQYVNDDLEEHVAKVITYENDYLNFYITQNIYTAEYFENRMYEYVKIVSQINDSCVK